MGAVQRAKNFVPVSQYLARPSQDFRTDRVHLPSNPRDNASTISHGGKALDWRAVNEQQQEALWRVFLMFIAMALLIIRTGLVSRGALAAVSLQTAPQHAAPVADYQPTSTSPDQRYQATLVLLYLAEAAGRLFILKARAIWELMNQPRPLPAPGRPSNVANLCERPEHRLDTS